MTVLLNVPGYTGSGPGHWPTLWEKQDPAFRRVEQRDWNAPVKTEWIAALDREIARTAVPIVLIGHSLGSITIVLWAARHRTPNVLGAFLVAPSDVESEAAPRLCRRFAPVPTAPLPFPSVVVASSTDPMMTFERSRQLADAWGASLVDAGPAGHLNTASGHGPWPEGRAMLSRFLARIEAAREG